MFLSLLKAVKCKVTTTTTTNKTENVYLLDEGHDSEILTWTLNSGILSR